MKKLVLLGACLVALASSPVKAQTGGADVVVMSVRAYGIGTTRIVLAYSDGKTEEKQIKDLSTERGQDESTITYQSIIAGLYQKGYTLKSTFSEARGIGSNLVFVKEK